MILIVMKFLECARNGTCSQWHNDFYVFLTGVVTGGECWRLQSLKMTTFLFKMSQIWDSGCTPDCKSLQACCYLDITSSWTPLSNLKLWVTACCLSCLCCQVIIVGVDDRSVEAPLPQPMAWGKCTPLAWDCSKCFPPHLAGCSKMWQTKRVVPAFAVPHVLSSTEWHPLKGSEKKHQLIPSLDAERNTSLLWHHVEVCHHCGSRHCGGLEPWDDEEDPQGHDGHELHDRLLGQG